MKPSNWYEMTWEEQRDWQKQQREIDDLEYAARQAQEEAERTQANYNAARREMRAERDSWGDEWERQQKRVNELEEINAELLEVLKSALETAEFEKAPFRPWHQDARAAIAKARPATHWPDS